MNNEVAVIPYSDIRVMAADVYKAKMFNLQTPEAAMSLMLLAQAEGIHPMNALRQFHILHDGRPSMRADTMLAKYRMKGGKVEWLTQADDRVAQRGRWTFEGQVIEIGFTMAEAIQAGYTSATPKPGSGWHRDPAAMLRARTISRACRMLAPEIVVGLYTPEEMEDIPLDNGGPRAKNPNIKKLGPEYADSAVLESTPGTAAAVASNVAAQAAAVTAPAVDPAEPTDPAQRLKYLRGKLNQALLAVKTGKEFQKVRGDFERSHGKPFVNELTGHPVGAGQPPETFISLMTVHWNRIERVLRNEKFRLDVSTTQDVPTFRKLEEYFFNADVDQSKENEEAINAKGKALQLAEYTGGAVSESAEAAAAVDHQGLALEEDFNAQMEGGAQ